MIVNVPHADGDVTNDFALDPDICDVLEIAEVLIQVRLANIQHQHRVSGQVEIELIA
jgi:hypothetical protein